MRRVWWGTWAVLVGLGALSGARMTGPAPYDLLAFSQGGRLVLTGHWGSVYGSDWLQAGPFELVGSFLILPDIRSQALLAGQRILLAALVIALVPLLVRRLRRSCGLAPAPVAELAAAVLCLVLRLPVDLLNISHLSQPAICLLWIWAAVRDRDGRILSAALILGVSAGWEPWGILGAPILLVGRDLRRLVPAGALMTSTAVAAYLPFVVAGPFRLFGHGWPIGPYTFAHQIWPTAVRFDWSMRVAQSLVALGVGVLAVLLLRTVADVVWAAPVAAVLGRLMLDPLVLPYYWQPVALLVVVACGLMTRRSWSVRVMTILVLGSFASFPAWAASYEMVLPTLAALVAVGVPAAVFFVAAAVFHSDGRRDRGAAQRVPQTA